MKNILITGAGNGMGKATAEYLANKGYIVFAMDIVKIEPSENIIPIQVDVTKNDSVLNAYNEVCKYANTLDAIVHFAGIYIMNSLVEIDEKDFTKIFDINVFGVYRINKVFLPLLLEKEGRIIITSSELAPLDPLPFTGLYAITKSTIEKYAFSLRMELNLLNIKVSVLRTGAVNTNMLSASTQSLEKMCNTTKLYKYNSNKFKDIVNSVESKKIEPIKIAKLIDKIILVKKPKFVYKINANKYLKLLNALPDRIQVAIIKKILTKR